MPEPRRLLTPDDVPALLGLPDADSGRFTLYHALTGAYDEAVTGNDARHLHAIRDAAAARWRAAHGHRAPTAPRRHPTLPLAGAPDGILEPDSLHGAGKGIATVELVETGAWRRLWRNDQAQPHPTAPALARLHALLLLYRVQWAVVVPQVGISRLPRRPLTVIPDPVLMERITHEIETFAESIARGFPPDPDARADRTTLRALATQAAPPAAEVRTLDPETTRTLHEYIGVLDARGDAHDKLRAQTAEARERRDNALAAIVQLLGGPGVYDLGHATLRLTSETAPTRDPAPFVQCDIDHEGTHQSYRL